MSGAKCHNKSFERGSNDDDFEVFDLKWGGKGLKTLKDIKKGQFIIEYVGEVISVAESKAGLEFQRKTFYLCILSGINFKPFLDTVC